MWMKVWQVAILLWMVGARGLVKETLLKEALEFMAIPTTAWKSVLGTSVRTSVAAFAFLNQVRFSTPQAQKTWGTLDRHGPTDQEEMPTVEPTVNGDARNRGKRTWGN